MKKTKLKFIIILLSVMFLFLPQIAQASDYSYDWTHTMGGTGTEISSDIAVDSSNNIYLTGYFQNTVDFDPTAGVDNKTSNGATDIFLTKINANGSYGWTYTMGGTAEDKTTNIEIDSLNNIYLSGNFRDTVDFDPTGGVNNKTSNGYYDIFLTKINSNTTYGWTYTMGAGSDDYGKDLNIDSLNNIYLTGSFRETVDFDPTVGVDNKTTSGGLDIFLTKINSNATYGWTYAMGEGLGEEGSAIGIDSLNNIYLSGNFNGTLDFNPTGGVDNKTSNGLYDIFLTKINSDASYGWTYTMGGTADDFNASIAVDSSNNIYLTGYFQNTVDFDPTAGVDNKTSNGSYDIFLTKINANTSYGWTYTMGGTGTDIGVSIITDSFNNIYLTGYFHDTVDFDPTAGVDNKTINGNNNIFNCDIFLTKINANASYGWTYTMGGTGTDVGESIVTDSSDNIYLTGCFQETVDLNPTSGVDNRTSNGGYDIFLSKFSVYVAPQEPLVAPQEPAAAIQEVPQTLPTTGSSNNLLFIFILTFMFTTPFVYFLDRIKK